MEKSIHMEEIDFVERQEPKIETQKIINKTSGDLTFSFNFLESKNTFQEISSIINELETRLNMRLKTKNTLGLISELLENIDKHTSLDSSKGHKASFQLYKTDSLYKVCITNFCLTKDYIKLKNFCVLNEMQKDEITNRYTRASKTELSERGGAGLGLLTIAQAIKKKNPSFKDIFSVKPIKEIDESCIDELDPNQFIEISFTVNLPIFAENPQPGPFSSNKECA